MGKKKGPELPNAPSIFQDPTVRPSLDQLLETGTGLTRGNFLNAQDPTVGFLNELVTLNPAISQQAFDLASRPVIEAQNLSRQNLFNQLEAANQLESSVTGNRLADLERDFSRDLSDISTRIQLADAERSLSNIGNLFTTGLSTLGNVNSLGQANEQAQNAFRQQQFENQVNLARARAQGKGSSLGSTIGTILGGAAGSFGGPGGMAIGAGLGGQIGGLFDDSGSQGLGSFGGGFFNLGGNLLTSQSLGGRARGVSQQPLMNPFGGGNVLEDDFTRSALGSGFGLRSSLGGF